MRFYHPKTTVTRLICLAAFAALLFSPGISGAAVVVDFSPDTTAQPVFGTFSNRVTPGDPSRTQYLGDRFTLSSATTITGGSIFSNSNFVGGGGVVSDAVRFMIFADAAGLPGPALFDIGTTIDVVDTTLTTTQPTLTRKHATIAPITLAAGSYWFSMPGNSVDIGQASTTLPGYDNGNFAAGVSYPPALLAFISTQGDLFFTLEDASVGAAVPEPVSFAIWGLGALGLAVAARRKRKPA